MKKEKILSFTEIIIMILFLIGLLGLMIAKPLAEYIAIHKIL